MTNQVAITMLKNLEQSLDDYCELNDEGKEAFHMAITALELFGNSEQLPSTHSKLEKNSQKLDNENGELISRQEAIDLVKSFYKIDKSVLKIMVFKLKQLPSVQPELSNNSPELDIKSGELISRQKAKDAIDMALDHIDHVPPWVYDKLLNALNEVPSAQPRKGKWIYGEHESAMCDGYRCDKCGFFVPWDYQHKFIDFIKDYNYCPSCGADMRG